MQPGDNWPVVVTTVRVNGQPTRARLIRLSLLVVGACVALALQGCGSLETEPVYVRNGMHDRISLAGDCTADAIFLDPGNGGMAETLSGHWTTCGVRSSDGTYLGCIITPAHAQATPFVVNAGSLSHLSEQECQDWVGPASP